MTLRGPNFSEGSRFCSEISSGGSIFFEKFVPGGTNFGGSIFTVTLPSTRPAALPPSSCLSAPETRQIVFPYGDLCHAAV